jgi:hypothetical protein
MDHFYKTNTETDLETLHYVAFIDPPTVFPTEACPLTLNSLWTTTQSTRWLKQKQLTISYYSKNISRNFVVQKKYEVQFESLLHEVLEFFSEP